MKNLFLGIVLLATGSISAQNVWGDTLHETTDSIGYLESICFDSNVVHYKMDYTYKGRAVTVESPNKCYTLTGKLPSGTVLHFYDIFYELKPGVSKKLKPRNYIVK